MKPERYLILFVLAIFSLYADPSNPDTNSSFSDNNQTYRDTNLSMVEDQNITLTPFDLNSSQSEDINGTNWFYYRDFLTGMDTVQEYGTSTVIVIGSGIDYSLYWLFSDDENGTEPTDTNRSVSEDNNGTTFLGKAITKENKVTVKEFVSSHKGKDTLPKQLDSRNKRKGEQTYLISQWFDEETINDSFLDISNESYVRLRGGYVYHHRDENEYIHSITARVKIPRTKDKLDLIIGDDTKQSSDISLEGTDQERDNSIALGTDNLLEMFDVIDSQFRVGFSGIKNPYTKLRLSYKALFDKWLIEPSQTFKYSLEVEYEEWTNLEFKRRIEDNKMFSLLIQRSSQSRIDGMEYFIQPAVSFSMGEYGNMTPYIGAYGCTKEQPEDEDGYVRKRGVYTYAVGVNWSKQASRKYIVYRVQPIVSYDDKHGFRPNYHVKALLEFYIGLQD
ncbi:MAG: hypothetical protein U9Q62_03875 [Campylobacterota bacterium]|nr:hypothetical protein [Campylobacterota bacterium]